jgi:poly(A) polymerase Pap1
LPFGVRIETAVVGSRAIGADTASSDVDVLAVGNVNLNTFFELFKSRIRKWNAVCAQGETVIPKRHVKDAAVQMMKLSVCGASIDLQYAPAAKVVERYVISIRLTFQAMLMLSYYHL